VLLANGQVGAVHARTVPKEHLLPTQVQVTADIVHPVQVLVALELFNAFLVHRVSSPTVPDPSAAFLVMLGQSRLLIIPLVWDASQEHTPMWINAALVYQENTRFTPTLKAVLFVLGVLSTMSSILFRALHVIEEQ
jgi:hypothetical protein